MLVKFGDKLAAMYVCCDNRFIYPDVTYIWYPMKVKSKSPVTIWRGGLVIQDTFIDPVLLSIFVLVMQMSIRRDVVNWSAFAPLRHSLTSSCPLCRHLGAPYSVRGTLSSLCTTYPYVPLMWTPSSWSYPTRSSGRLWNVCKPCFRGSGWRRIRSAITEYWWLVAPQLFVQVFEGRSVLTC